MTFLSEVRPGNVPLEDHLHLNAVVLNGDVKNETYFAYSKDKFRYL